MSSENLIWLVEIEAYDDTVPGVVTLRYSSDESYYDASLREYLPRLLRPLTVSQSLFSRFATFGSARTGVGEIALINSDGALDYLDSLGFDGRAVRVFLGDPESPYSEFEEIFIGTMEQAEFTLEEVRIRVRDKLALFEVPVTESIFAGTNVGPAGIEGTSDDIGGQSKNRLWGKVRNIPATKVNSSLLIFGVNWDRSGATASVASFDAIYDQGVSITIAADYADLAALQGATIPTGQAATCVAEGLFRMERTLGAITCDVTESATAADNKLPRVLERLINDAGGTLSAEDLSRLEASSYYDVGVWTAGEDYKRILDKIAESDGIAYYGDRTGDLTFRAAKIDHSLIIQADDFSASSWTKINTTIGSTVTAPDGRSLASKVIATSANANHAISAEMLPRQSDGYFSSFVYAKAAEYSQFLLYINNSGNIIAGQFELSNGSGLVGPVGAASDVSYSIEELTDGWFLCSVSGRLGAIGAAVPSVQLFVGSGAFAGDDAGGIYFWMPEAFSRPAPVATLVQADGETPMRLNDFDIIDIERRSTGDKGRGIPAFKVDLEWGPIGRVLGEADLAGSIFTGSPELVEFFGNEYRTKSVSDPSVQTKHPLAPTLSFRTAIYSDPDAEAVVNRFAQIYSQPRKMYRVTIEMKSELRQVIELGAIVELRLDRWGLSIGRRLVIVGIEYDAATFEYELTLWG